MCVSSMHHTPIPPSNYTYPLQGWCGGNWTFWPLASTTIEAIPLTCIYYAQNLILKNTYWHIDAVSLQNSWEQIGPSRPVFAVRPVTHLSPVQQAKMSWHDLAADACCIHLPTKERRKKNSAGTLVV